MGTGYNPRIVTENLVFCVDAANTRSYPKTGTTWTDLKGGNNGTLTNMTASNFSSENAGALNFDGVDEYITIPNELSSKFTNGYEFTFSTFSTITSLAGNGSVLFSASTAPDTRLFIQLQSSTVYFGSVNPTNYSSISYSSSSYINKPSLFTWTQNSSNFSFYLNDLFIASSTARISDFSIFSGFRFGAYVGSGFEHTGKTYSVHLYDRALTADEIRQNYLATKERYA